MKHNDEQTTPATSTGGSASMSAGRRGLIRGAFALPALATVHPGSALAAGSSLRCLVNPPYDTLPGVVATGTNESPAFRRVELGALIKNGTEEVLGYYVDGNNVKVVEPSAAFIGANQWQPFDITANATSGSIQNTEPTSNGNSASYTRQSGKMAVLVYDSNGVVAGVGDRGETFYAASHSCWTSFAA